MKETVFSKTEMRFLLGIGFALALRQLGLIMVMPFLAIYGRQLAYSTPGLIGLSLGVYGLSQAVFQIPFGHFSDRLGRKTTILAGMFLFILGLLLAYLADNIYVFIVARVLQGSGAIMAAAYAWVGDNIRQEQRNRGMSIIGIMVGMSATLAFIGGPVLHRWFSVPQMFLLCAVLALVAFIYIWLFLTGDGKPVNSTAPEKIGLLSWLQDRNLLKLFVAGFINNYLMVSQFFIVPLLLEKSLGVDGMWKVFVPATLVAVLAMRAGAKYADAGYFHRVATVSFVAIGAGSLIYYSANLYLVGLGMHLFMMAHMCLVTLLPASVTKFSAKRYRGTVTGVFNTWQFIGSFVGGSLTGFLWGENPDISLLLMAGMALLGALVIRNVAEAETDREEIIELTNRGQVKK